MYREKELIGKEVITPEGGVLGEVIEVSMIDDVPVIVVGKKGFLVGKERVLQSKNTVSIPYYEIATVHDKIMLSRNIEDILRDLKG
jgi:sporulation protein YlmC with PRC-barrel domain